MSLSRQPQQDLIRAVEATSGGRAKFVESVEIKESFQGLTVWIGAVSVFEIKGSKISKRGYAWERIEDDGRRSQVVVLHRPPVDSPLAAVRASIVAEYEAKRSKTK